MKIIPFHLSLLILLVAIALPRPAVAAEPEVEQLSVGYFVHWPTPSQFSRLTGTYDAVIGVPVNWIPFEDGEQMVAALDSGRIQIAYSLGLVPFLAGLSRDIALTMIGVAVAYPDYDNCVLRSDAAETDLTLEGAAVALIPGGVAHFNLLETLQARGMDSGRVQIRAAQDGAGVVEALREGDAILACAHGAALEQLRPFGRLLLSTDEQMEMGLRAFDAIAVSPSFMHSHAELVQAFMDVTEATNAQWRENPDPMRAAIARGAEMNPFSAADTMSRFDFPSAEEQKSETWLGGAVAVYVGELAEFFVDQGSLPKAKESYSPYITSRFLR